MNPGAALQLPQLSGIGRSPESLLDALKAEELPSTEIAGRCPTTDIGR
jgi:hypothetical protein